MYVLVTKVFLKSLQLVCLLMMSIESFTNERPLEYMSPKHPFLSPNIPILINKASQYILVFLIATEVSKLS